MQKNIAICFKFRISLKCKRDCHKKTFYFKSTDYLFERYFYILRFLPFFVTLIQLKFYLLINLIDFCNSKPLNLFHRIWKVYSSTNQLWRVYLEAELPLLRSRPASACRFKPAEVKLTSIIADTTNNNTFQGWCIIE